jgi:uncharacterized protein (DUF2062 family)
MTPPTPDGDRWKACREDGAWFFDRHPILHLVYTFSLLFTLWSLAQFFFAFGGSPRSYGSQIYSALFYAGFVTVILGVVQHFRRKRRAQSHRDAQSVI